MGLWTGLETYERECSSEYVHKNIGKLIYTNGKNVDSVFVEFSETVREFEFLIDDEN